MDINWSKTARAGKPLKQRAEREHYLWSRWDYCRSISENETNILYLIALYSHLGNPILLCIEYLRFSYILCLEIIMYCLHLSSEVGFDSLAENGAGVLSWSYVSKEPSPSALLGRPYTGKNAYQWLMVMTPQKKMYWSIRVGCYCN